MYHLVCLCNVHLCFRFVENVFVLISGRCPFCSYPDVYDQVPAFAILRDLGVVGIEEEILREELYH